MERARKRGKGERTVTFTARTCPQTGKEKKMGHIQGWNVPANGEKEKERSHSRMERARKQGKGERTVTFTARTCPQTGKEKEKGHIHGRNVTRKQYLERYPVTFIVGISKVHKQR